MDKLLIATSNPGKVGEYTKFFSDLPIQLVSLRGAYLDDETVEENGVTYKENAEKKALFYAKLGNMPAISDDGGIEISALGGAPGIRSRRWLGHEMTDEELVNYMLNISKTLPDDNRTAYFKVVIAFALPSGKVWTVEGQIQGIIAHSPDLVLLRGYPYRSFFYLPKIKKYYHEDQLTETEQKQYNHRYIAIQRIKPIVKRELGLKASSII